MKLNRHSGNPLLKPRGDDWESVAVFNPSATLVDNRIHLLYRAVGEYFPYTSRLGHAVFDTDLNLIERQQEPVFVHDAKLWERSIEDPRVSMIEDELYLTYVTTPTPGPPGAVRRKLGLPNPPESAGPRTAIAKMNGFDEYERYGIITPYGADERDVVPFPEKINGRYAFIHRPANWVGDGYGTMGPSIWYGDSESLNQEITNHKLVMKAEAQWEGNKVGAGPPPIKTDAGWLLIYHGVDQSNIYRGGAALLDLLEPWKVLARTPDPILEPEMDYELYGDVPNVVFPEGLVTVGNKLIIFYGGADKVCCAASVNLDEFIADLLSGGNQGK